MSPAIRDLVAKLAAHGLPVSAIAANVGLDEDDVRELLTEATARQQRQVARSPKPAAKDSEERDATIVALRKGGSSLRQIGAAVGVSESRVRQRLKALGVVIPKAPALDESKLRKLAGAGLTGTEIAAAMGSTPSAIRAAARYRGILFARGSRARGLLADHDDEIAKAHRDGLSPGAIARTLGWSRPAVRERLVALGLLVPRHHRKGRHVDVSADAQMVAMRDQGATLQQIAEHFGISRERVRQRIVRHMARDT